MEKQRAVCYHERKLKALQTPLERGTIPKTLRLKSFPKMKTPEGQVVIQEACNEVQKIMLIQMVEEQKQVLAQAQKEVQSSPKEIKFLQKELKSLQTRLLKLQKAQVKQGQLKTEDTPNSIEN